MDREIISDTIYAVFSVVVSVVGRSSCPSRQRLRLLSDHFLLRAQGPVFLDLKPCHVKRARLLKYILCTVKLAKIGDPTAARENI